MESGGFFGSDSSEEWIEEPMAYSWELQRNYKWKCYSTDTGTRIWPFQKFYHGLPYGRLLTEYKCVIITPAEYLIRKIKGEVR